MAERTKLQDNVRAQHVGRFSITQLRTSTVIRYDGEVLIRIRRGDQHAAHSRPGKRSEAILNGLPEGFLDRLAQLMMETVTGIRPELWDMQSVYGAKVDPTRPRMSALCDDPVCPHAGIPHYRTVSLAQSDRSDPDGERHQE